MWDAFDLTEKVIFIVISLNLLFSGLAKFLDHFKNMTSATWDNKLADLLSKVTALLQKLIDYASGNRKH